MVIRGTQALEVWARRVTSGYRGVRLVNMTSAWRDGMAFCAILHRYRPDLIDYHSLDPSQVEANCRLVFNLAEKELGIPALLDPKDMAACHSPDRLSILTYLSEFYHKFAGNGTDALMSTPPKAAAEKIKQRKSSSEDSGVESNLSVSLESSSSSLYAELFSGGDGAKLSPERRSVSPSSSMSTSSSSEASQSAASKFLYEEEQANNGQAATVPASTTLSQSGSESDTFSNCSSSSLSTKTAPLSSVDIRACSRLPNADFKPSKLNIVNNNSADSNANLNNSTLSLSSLSLAKTEAPNNIVDNINTNNKECLDNRTGKRESDSTGSPQPAVSSDNATKSASAVTRRCRRDDYKPRKAQSMYVESSAGFDSPAAKCLFENTPTPTFSTPDSTNSFQSALIKFQMLATPESASTANKSQERKASPEEPKPERPAPATKSSPTPTTKVECKTTQTDDSFLKTVSPSRNSRGSHRSLSSGLNGSRSKSKESTTSGNGQNGETSQQQLKTRAVTSVIISDNSAPRREANSNKAKNSPKSSPEMEGASHPGLFKFAERINGPDKRHGTIIEIGQRVPVPTALGQQHPKGDVNARLMARPSPADAHQRYMPVHHFMPEGVPSLSHQDDRPQNGQHPLHQPHAQQRSHDMMVWSISPVNNISRHHHRHSGHWQMVDTRRLQKSASTMLCPAPTSDAGRHQRQPIMSAANGDYVTVTDDMWRPPVRGETIQAPSSSPSPVQLRPESDRRRRSAGGGMNRNSYHSRSSLSLVGPPVGAEFTAAGNNCQDPSNRVRGKPIDFRFYDGQSTLV